MAESNVQQQVRLAFAPHGHLWRNNVGAMQDASGRVVRFGLANESAQLNRRIKSSDLIGLLPLTITPAHVGRVLGVFVALETKRPGWHLRPGDDHGQAQARFHDVVREAGGFAGFVTDAREIWSVVR